MSQFETNGLKGVYFRGVATECFQRGVELMRSTCTFALTASAVPSTRTCSNDANPVATL